MASNTFTRRALLQRATGAGAGLALWPAFAAAQAQRPPNPYAPFRIGIQSYSLRGYKTLDEALAKINELGIRYVEAYSAHVPLTTDEAQAAEIRRKFRAAGARLTAHGVNRFTKDDAANRKIFEAAKALRFRTLTADPDPDSFDSLDKLVAEFEINVAIHNHGPGHRYDKLEDVTNAIKGHHKRIGACVDTGHFLRSGVNPVKVIETIGDRVYAMHLKDVKDKTQFTILGKGDLDLAGTLKALQAVKYEHPIALEYEENPENPIADIRACLDAIKAAIPKV